jgi:hypothetical protein
MTIAPRSACARIGADSIADAGRLMFLTGEIWGAEGIGVYACAASGGQSSLLNLPNAGLSQMWRYCDLLTSILITEGSESNGGQFAAATTNRMVNTLEPP